MSASGSMQTWLHARRMLNPVANDPERTFGGAFEL
jgi:hypothetical protein